VWHNGQAGGSHGFIGLDKARHTVVVVLSSSVSSIDDIGFHLLDERVELAAAERQDRPRDHGRVGIFSSSWRYVPGLWRAWSVDPMARARRDLGPVVIVWPSWTVSLGLRR
jgi:hypothetical protein